MKDFSTGKFGVDYLKGANLRLVSVEFSLSEMAREKHKVRFGRLRQALDCAELPKDGNSALLEICVR